METRLQLLFQLQNIDLQLDELQEQKGDLPGIVARLEEELGQKTAAREAFQSSVKQTLVRRDAADADIIDLRAKIEKWKTQQFEVKTNKQYDMLAKEIDAAQNAIARITKEMELLEGQASVAREDGEKLAPEIEALSSELADRRKDLDAVNKEHEDEELKLQHERQKIVARLQARDQSMYERIRRANDGRAVVPIRRGACGGCFNRVPPQRVLELRRNDMFMTCERCGRLLVSDDIVGRANAHS